MNGVLPPYSLLGLAKPGFQLRARASQQEPAGLARKGVRGGVVRGVVVAWSC